MKLYELPPLVLQKLIWIPTRLTLTVFGRLEIRGLENIREIEKNAIFAMNHSSEIDPFIVPSSLPFWSRFSPLFYATREKKFYDRSGWRKHMFGGWFINAWGGYTVNTGLHDYAKSLVDHLGIIRDGCSFCVFPEGGITRDGNLQEGRGGVAYLAEAASCAIVPVSVSGVYQTTIGQFFGRKRKIVVHFGKPISYAELLHSVDGMGHQGANLYKEQAKYVMKKIGEGMQN